MELISAIQNPKIKAYISLNFSKKERHENGLFVLEGLRLCMDVLRSNLSIHQLFFTEDAFLKNEDDIKALISISSECYMISQKVSEKMADTKTPQGVFCVLPTLDKQNNSNKIDISGKYILLDNVQDPANLGAISRTAEALGITGLIVSGGCDVYSPKAMRASMGSLLRIPVIETENVIETIKQAQNDGMLIYASTPRQDAEDITTISFTEGVMTVIGNEANGVSESVLNCCNKMITIRMAGRAESLNAGAAASIIMWEMVMPRNVGS